MASILHHVQLSEEMLLKDSTWDEGQVWDLVGVALSSCQ